MELPHSFPHVPPDGYCYRTDQFKPGYLSIWIGNYFSFSYTQDSPVYSIWGFYNVKKKKYFSPVNSKTIGKEVDIAATSPYTAMQILKPLRPSVLSFV